MGKFSSIVLGAASGAAAAIFLSSEKGKEVRARVSNFFKRTQMSLKSGSAILQLT